MLTITDVHTAYEVFYGDEWNKPGSKQATLIEQLLASHLIVPTPRLAGEALSTQQQIYDGTLPPAPVPEEFEKFIHDNIESLLWYAQRPKNVDRRDTMIALANVIQDLIEEPHRSYTTEPDSSFGFRLKNTQAQQQPD